MKSAFVLFLFLFSGHDDHSKVDEITTATFANRAACEQALTRAMNASDKVSGYCAPAKVKVRRAR